MRRGQVGDLFYTGEVVLTRRGNPTTPFPKITMGTDRKAMNTCKRVKKWLVENAVAEAERLNDDFNKLQFDEINPDRASPADLDGCETYLFVDPLVDP